MSDGDRIRLAECEQVNFENWFTENYTAHKLGRKQTIGGDSSSDYRDERVQIAFKAWLASKKIHGANPPKESK